MTRGRSFSHLHNSLRDTGQIDLRLTAGLQEVSAPSFLGTNDDDTAYGGNGNDTFHGLDGNDLLVGNDGNDWLYGDDGADVLAGWAGTDVMYGGDGNDTFLPGSGNDSGYGGAGQDYFTCNFVPTPSSFYWDGGADNDLFALNEMTDGTVIGGDGAGDVLQLYWFGTTVLTPVIFTPAAATFLGLSLTISEIEIFRITTGSGHDNVTTADGADVISLEWGANIARAMGGNDVVSYSVGLANDLDGGNGNDTLILTQVPWGYAMNFDASGADVTDGFGSRIVGFENYQVTGLGADDSAKFASGADLFSGQRGNDSAWGGSGDDMLRGGVGNDSLSGDQGNDSLIAADGNDWMSGGIGKDVLVFGAGSDTVSGGSESDKFLFSAIDAATDQIDDFTSGSDVLVFRNSLLAASLSLGRQAAGSLSLGAATTNHGQFVLRDVGGNGLLLWDSNGATAGGETELAWLMGVTRISSYDIFILV